MNIHLDRESSIPLYRQIVRQVREMILAGSLPPGFHLPPERRLAEALGVTRTTVISAYEELKAEGFATAHVGRGTSVLSPQHPVTLIDTTHAMAWNRLFREETTRPPDPLLRDLLDLTTKEGIISFAVGVPSRDLIPVALFRDAASRLLDEAGAETLHHSPTEGHPPLRESLSRWLTARGIRCTPEEVLVLSGSQQGLHLVSRLLVHPGDTVIVEEPSYFGGLEALRRAGARMISIPVDDQGMRVDLLEAILERHRPKLIYTLPTFQNPSGMEMSLERRKKLLALASARGIPLLEEDPYSELRYDGTPLPSLKALDTTGIVLYLATSSKILFPGLRIGWLVAPKPVVRQCTLLKQSEDLHTNTLGQFVLDRLFREGHLERHLEKLRTVYRKNRDLMEGALQKYAPEGMTWSRPRGGFYFWCLLPDGVNRTQLLASAAAKRIAFLPGQACFVEETGRFYIRLNFSAPSPSEIPEGVARLAQAIREALVERRPQRERLVPMRPIV
jgi:DNA-binding transcriptional MocR family regulator